MAVILQGVSLVRATQMRWKPLLLGGRQAGSHQVRGLHCALKSLQSRGSFCSVPPSPPPPPCSISWFDLFLLNLKNANGVCVLLVGSPGILLSGGGEDVRALHL